MTKLIIAAVAASLATLSAAPAAAQTLRVEVGYTQAFIGSDAGATALAEQIEHEVATACGRQHSRTLGMVTECRGEMLADAVEQLNAKGAVLAAGKLATRG